jgi:hypothetical protein
MKKLTIIIIITFVLSSCARWQQGCKRETGTRRNYEIILFSGGDTVFIDHPKRVVINQEEGDGIYYYKDDTLIEMAGTYIIKSEK